MVFLNETDLIGQTIYYFTYNITGSLFLTLLCLVIGILLLTAAFRMPLEISAVLVLPLLIVFMAQYGGEWKSIAGVFLIYLAVLFARFWMRD